MAQKRVILELGTGNDLHGGDYTKAALRAVQDALHHSSLVMLRALEVNPKTGMFVNVTIGVQQPDKVDVEKVRASLPHGIVTVKAGKPSTSFSGSTASMIVCVSICAGRGSCTRMPSTAGSAFSRATWVMSASSDVSAGRWTVRTEIPASLAARSLLRT